MSCWWSTTCKMQCSDEEKQRDVRSTPCAGVCSEAQILRGTGVLDLPALRLRSPRCHCPRRGARDSSPLWGQSYYATKLLPFVCRCLGLGPHHDRASTPTLCQSCSMAATLLLSCISAPSGKVSGNQERELLQLFWQIMNSKVLYTRYRCDAFLFDTAHTIWVFVRCPQGTSRPVFEADTCVKGS